MMPVSGFHRGDRVLTPNGREATVVRIIRRAPETVDVEYDDERRVRIFRTSALRRIATNREGQR